MVQETAAKVAAAAKLIDEAETPPVLDDLAEAVGLSPFHFHRLFKAATGLTPRQYADAKRGMKVRAALKSPSTVTQAIYEAGFNANSRFYAQSAALLGMTPTAYKDGGARAQIRFAIGQSSLGAILVASSDKGVCSILIGDDPQDLAEDLQRRFGKAQLVGDDPDFAALVALVVGFVEAPKLGLDLPLDVRGTAFQQRVWQALRAIPAGSTASYADVAAAIGSPKAVRAVAGACAANPIAVAIPCHRVLRNDGALSGYRWGVERKQALLNAEAS
jgi:AraC family transcriptional regulator of adaptative response/methylated-DNA-[protein]-cysteine methyltransferase